MKKRLGDAKSPSKGNDNWTVHIVFDGVAVVSAIEQAAGVLRETPACAPSVEDHPKDSSPDTRRHKSAEPAKVDEHIASTVRRKQSNPRVVGDSRIDPPLNAA